MYQFIVIPTFILRNQLLDVHAHHYLHINQNLVNICDPNLLHILRKQFLGVLEHTRSLVYSTINLIYMTSQAIADSTKKSLIVYYFYKSLFKIYTKMSLIEILNYKRLFNINFALKRLL